jgi:hypothetical protein
LEFAVPFIRRWLYRALIAPVFGEACTLPDALGQRWPELRRVRWRRGGLPVRVGGWCLGQPSVAGITLWRTVFLAPGVPWDPALLLHEHRHVEQFASSAVFPLQYIWESLTHGYARNRFEADANAWAAARFAAHSSHTTLSPGA